MKRKTLRWSGHTERMKSEEFVKKVYVSKIKGPSRKGRPLGRWKGKVTEGLVEGEGWNKQRRSVWIGRDGGFWRTFLETARHQSYSYRSEVDPHAQSDHE